MMNSQTRRRFLNTLSALGLAGVMPISATTAGAEQSDSLEFAEPIPFSFENLIEQARRKAAEDYRPTTAPSSDLTRRINYDIHGKIRFPAEKALFQTGEGRYPATFFHLGMYFQKPVSIHAVSQGEAARLKYRSDYFNMPSDSIARKMPDDAGFAGFRLHEDRARDDWKTQDWIAFLGASYFRSIGDEGQYGLSARGIAVDTAISGPEEFPDFTDFYIQPGADNDVRVHIYALLDGPSLTGAFHFILHRNKGVEIEVESRLFCRKSVERLGVAPLTSMFWYSEYRTGHSDDWRPEIHDSDGLALWTGAGERIWRPLNNPPVVTVSSFMDNSPRGFGLIQRDRSFENYLDGVRYERRPSLWIEPLNNWGAGSVQLVEIPTDDEVHDNIVAFWVPGDPVLAGNEYTFRYRMYWYAKPPYTMDSLAHATALRMGRGGQPGTDRPQGVRKFVIDFAEGPLADIKADDPVELLVEASRGTISNSYAEPIPGTDRWRALFDLKPVDERPVELRAWMRIGDQPITETWLYQYFPTPS